MGLAGPQHGFVAFRGLFGWFRVFGLEPESGAYSEGLGLRALRLEVSRGLLTQVVAKRQVGACPQ